MRNIKVFLEILYQRFVLNWKVNLVMLGSLILTFSFLNLIGNDINTKISKFEDLNEAKRTYITSISSSASVVQAFDAIIKQWVKKEIVQSKRVRLNSNIEANGTFYLYFSYEYASLNSENAEANLTKGRLFTSTELANGVNVLILSQEDYLTYYKNYRIGDNISIYNHDFKLIGISKSHSLLPYSTVYKLAKNSLDLFVINELILNTREPLSQKEITHMIQVSSNVVPSAEYEINSDYYSSLMSKIDIILGSILIAIIISIICIVNLVFNLRILFVKDKLVTNIYLSLGYRYNYVVLGIIFELLIMVIVSVSISVFIANYLAPVITDLTMI